MLALMLAAAVQCADRAACPSREEVERALAGWEYERVSQLNEEANARGSDHVTLIPLQHIRVTGMQCGAPSGTPSSVICTVAIVRYLSGVSTATVRLVRRQGHWEWENGDGIYSAGLVQSD